MSILGRNEITHTNAARANSGSAPSSAGGEARRQRAAARQQVEHGKDPGRREGQQRRVLGLREAHEVEHAREVAA
jgi:hypothetical protein